MVIIVIINNNVIKPQFLTVITSADFYEPTFDLSI